MNHKSNAPGAVVESKLHAGTGALRNAAHSTAK